MVVIILRTTHRHKFTINQLSEAVSEFGDTKVSYHNCTDESAVASLDLEITNELTLFLIFFFDVGFTFFKVAISVAPLSSDPKLLAANSVAVELKVTLSTVNSSVLPSDLIKVYLSTSNGKNVSLVPAVGLEEVVICLSVISLYWYVPFLSAKTIYEENMNIHQIIQFLQKD